MDLTAIIGSILGLAAIVVGQWLSGGNLGQIIQFTPMLVVAGGTAGAVLLAFSWADICRAFSMVPSIYGDASAPPKPLIAEIVAAAQSARKDGILAMESVRAAVKDPNLKRALKFVGEGYEPATIREIMDAEIGIATEREEIASRVFEAAGSFSPTIGVIGAVLSLIQALSKLNEPARIGEGIAAAFVATIYGIAAANLVFLPWATRLRGKAQGRLISRELVRVGINGILAGEPPHVVQEKLEIHLKGASA